MNSFGGCFLAAVALSATSIGSFCSAQTVSFSPAGLAAGRATAGSAAAVAVLAGGSGFSPYQRSVTCATMGSIEDPASGDRWILERDPLHPEGPGKLVRGPSLTPGSCSSVTFHLQPQPVPLIRAGDPLLVEEHTASADIRLNAIALSPAAAGKSIPARITPGGSIIQVIASAPGRAHLAPPKEAKP
jgi:hypothetical protein